MLALYRRYPALARTLPRVDLRVLGTPIEKWDIGGVRLLIKRDDVNSATLGGNKVRALELLLAGAGPDATLLTVGSEGSTHALAVAHYGKRLSTKVEIITWPQEQNDVSMATRNRLNKTARITRASSVAGAYLRAFARRLGEGVRWVPAGGSSPLGAIAHANAAIELVTQLEKERLAPAEIVMPLGSGGTVAGMIVGLSLMESAIQVTAVRVVPGIVGNRRRVLSIARKAHRLLGQRTLAPIPPLNESLLHIEHGAFGGAYARETGAAREAATQLAAAGGPRLDGTYSAKAFGVALAHAREAPDHSVLFWLTFDGRWLDV